MGLILSTETPADEWEVETLFDLCFAPGREALSSYRLRDGVPPVADLCLVARDVGAEDGDAQGPEPSGGQGPRGPSGGQGPRDPDAGAGVLAGAIRHWPVLVGGAPALLLGPVAVHPTRQGEGVGALLIEGAMARVQGWARVLLVGDAPYYRRFGFRRLDGVVMPPPTNPDRVLGRALLPGAWDGITGEVTRAAGRG